MPERLPVPALDPPGGGPEAIRWARCPVSQLADLADVVLADIVGRLHTRLREVPLVGGGSAGERVGRFSENGLALLFTLGGEPELGSDCLERCRHVAEGDARFSFIYSLPRSAGFGAALGDTIQAALFGEILPSCSQVAALLNVFMTVLDGLVDNVPALLGPHRDALVTAVCGDAPQADPAGPQPPDDHPFNTLCFLVAALWRRKWRETGGTNGEAVTPAIRSALFAELADAGAGFAGGGDFSEEILYDRCRWPVWVQVLACLGPRGWPPGVAPAAFQRFVFRVADYTTYLDDLCDFVYDCRIRHWNSISHAWWRRYQLSYDRPDQLQRKLLARLAGEETAVDLIQLGLERRAAVSEAMASLPVPKEPLERLLEDLTHAYLG